jgi:hypothetical protein
MEQCEGTASTLWFFRDSGGVGSFMRIQEDVEVFTYMPPKLFLCFFFLNKNKKFNRTNRFRIKKLQNSI